nr:elongation factor-like GTPase 1 [Tanacetum cinerariifolium]
YADDGEKEEMVVIISRSSAHFEFIVHLNDKCYFFYIIFPGIFPLPPSKHKHGKKVTVITNPPAIINPTFLFSSLLASGIGIDGTSSCSSPSISELSKLHDLTTYAVLRQAWIEKVTPCLVLNKIDRLILELKLTPLEAYAKLFRIVHEVNGIVSTYKSEKYLFDIDSIIQSGTREMGDEGIEFIKDDEEDTFQPQKWNVVFACALDRWGFGICEFADFYASKLRASAGTLQKALWGPRYFIPKTKTIVATLDTNGDKGILEKLIKSFNFSVLPLKLQNRDPKVVLQSVMSMWLSLSDAILSMVVKHILDPVTAQSFCISRLLPKREILDSDIGKSDVIAEAELVKKSFEACDSRPESPCVAFVSKMFAVPIKMLPQRDVNGDIVNNYHEEGGSGDSDECFLAFARVLSGVIHLGQQVFVLSALYDPLKTCESVQKHIQEDELHSLYLMMGQGLKPVATARAGNIVAIRGLGQHILKSTTLASTKNCWPFSSTTFQVSPTLKAAIEPSDLADMAAFMKGLHLFYRADPFVEISVSARGEHVLAAIGEVHLERCIKDLKDMFAKVDLVVSPPLVSIILCVFSIPCACMCHLYVYNYKNLGKHY